MDARVFIADSTRVWCIHSASGAVSWMQQVGGLFRHGDISSVLVEDRRVLVGTQSAICCLDAETGDRLWETELAGASYKVLVTHEHPLANRGWGVD